MAAAIWLTVSGATAQTPAVQGPDPSVPTTPTTVAPPNDSPAPTPAPAPSPAPNDTLPPGAPAAPATPVEPAPAPVTTTTTVPGQKLNRAGLPPARTLEGSAQAVFSLDLSEIDALRRAARGKGPRTPEPDFGFDPALRFGSGVDTATEGDGGEALELGVEDEKIARVRSASAVAAGLMALLLTGMAVGALHQARTALPPRSGD